MSGKIKLQNLKALVRAPQGTLAFRFYLPIRYSTTPCNKAFGGRLKTAPTFSRAALLHRGIERTKILK